MTAHPSVLSTPDDELDQEGAALKQALLQVAAAQEQAAKAAAMTTHLDNRCVALRAQLNDALENVGLLEGALTKSEARVAELEQALRRSRRKSPAKKAAAKKTTPRRPAGKR